MFLEHDVFRFGTGSSGNIMTMMMRLLQTDKSRIINQLSFSATDVVVDVFLMYDGYVQTTRVFNRQEIMEILSLWSSAMLLPPIFYFSYFAMNINATCSLHSLLAIYTCILLSEQLIKVSSSFTKSKITNHFIMVCYHYFNIFMLLNKYACTQVRPIEILTGHHGNSSSRISSELDIASLITLYNFFDSFLLSSSLQSLRCCQ